MSGPSPTPWPLPPPAPSGLPGSARPPIPLAWANAPPWGAPQGLAPPSQPGDATRHAIEEIRNALGYYWIVLLLELLSIIVSGAFLGFAVGESPFFGTSQALSGVNTPIGSGSTVALLAVSAGIGLAVLILTIYSWVKWREGATDLKRWAGEFGPDCARNAHRVRGDVTRTTYAFVASLLVAIVFAGVVIALTVGPILAQYSTNRTMPPPTSLTLSAGTIASVRTAIVTVVLLESVVNVIMYGFATRSHVDAIAPFAPGEARSAADKGRQHALLGAMLGGVSVLGLFVPYAWLIGVLPPVLLVVGYQELRGALATVLVEPLRIRAGWRPVERFLF